MVSHNTTLVPSLGLCIGPACEAGLSTGMRREHVPPRIRKKERIKPSVDGLGALGIDSRDNISVDELVPC